MCPSHDVFYPALLILFYSTQSYNLWCVCVCLLTVTSTYNLTFSYISSIFYLYNKTLLSLINILIPRNVICSISYDSNYCPVDSKISVVVVILPLSLYYHYYHFPRLILSLLLSVSVVFTGRSINQIHHRARLGSYSLNFTTPPIPAIDLLHVLIVNIHPFC